VLKTNNYVITKKSVDDIKAIIATLHELVENDNFLPSYYSGGVAFTAHFIANLLKECFEKIIITSDNFNFSRSEDGFNPIHHIMKLYRKHIIEKRETILSSFRCSQGLPPTFDENKWKLVNTNPSAIERETLPLKIDNLKVNEAWCKHIEQYDTSHDYPVYQVRHEDFNLNAS
jgi:hypothetical protein